MRYISLFSGIEAASVAWHPLGWTPVAFAEFEPFPSAVLKERFPDVPNLGDVTKFKEWPDACKCDEFLSIRRDETSSIGGSERSIGSQASDGNSFCGECGGIYAPDIIVGGSPCQSFSVAGLRKGLDDPRGNLALTYLAIVEKYQPKWFVWENVPGVLSSNGGRDFGSFLGAVEKLGYGFAYRVLDAQYVRTPDFPHAVPQRRRRVFVVGCLGDAGRAAAVLFDGESLSRNPPPRREKRKGVATDAQRGFKENCEFLEPYQEVVGALCNADSKRISNQYVDQDKCILNYDSTAFKIRGGSETETGEYGGTPGRKADKDYLGSEELAFTIASSQDQHIFYPSVGETSPTVTSKWHKGSGGPAGSETGNMVVAQDIAGTLDASYHKGCGERGGIEREVVAYEYQSLRNAMRVRRLTPVECERLQGFPDDWTRIPWRKKEAQDCPDGPRYKAIGNSMAVNVMQWIGMRIAMVEEITDEIS